MKKIWRWAPLVAVSGVTLPLTTLAGCNKNNEIYYKVEYNTPPGLTWVDKPAAISINQPLIATFELQENFLINKSGCSVVSGKYNLTKYCTFTNTSVTLPKGYVTNNVEIFIAVTVPEERTVTCNYDSHISDVQCPSTILSTQQLTVSYKLDNGYFIDTEASEIKTGNTSIKDKIAYSNGTIEIPSEYLYDNITISLVSKIEVFDGVYESPDESAIVTDIGAGESVLHIYTIAPSATSNGVINVTLKGHFTNTQILIQDEGTYNITLDNCTISNTVSTKKKSEQPFLVKAKNTASEEIHPNINIILTTETQNTINDKRTYTTETSLNNDVALQSKSSGDFSIKGEGILNINNANLNPGPLAKGIQTKGSLTIDDLAEVNVFAYDAAIQSSGSIKINNSKVVATSYYSDGIKTKSDNAADDLALAGSGNIKKDITISSNANVTVYSATNAISSAHNFATVQDGRGSPTINLFTSTNTSGKTAGQQIANDQSMYIAIPEASCPYADIDNYYFTATFSDSTKTLKDTVEYMSLKKIRDEEGLGHTGPIYWFYKCDRPLEAYDSVTIKKYPKEQYGAETTPIATSKAFTITDGTEFNELDTLISTGINDSVIASDDSTFTKNYKYMISTRYTYDQYQSSKGIKCNNNIDIPTGEINIKSTDACISAAYGDTFVNSSNPGDLITGQGDINITGGSINAESINGEESTGDGIKAAGKLTISNGQLWIKKSFEALEAGQIDISGGEIKLCGYDDGMNAAQSGKYYKELVSLNISGGVIDVRTDDSVHDTDAIDSNYTLNITGGLIITRVNGAGMSAALDWENGNIKLDSATLIAIGQVEDDALTRKILGTRYRDEYITLADAGSHTIKSYSMGGITYTFENPTNMYKGAGWGVYVRSVNKPDIL